MFRNRSIVRLTVLAVIASTLVVAGTAGAAIPTTNSCPSTIPNAGFNDIGSFDANTRLAINCLVFYGITQGTTTTTFDPNGSVSRWQMALFLTRQAVDHGIALPSGASQGFTDISTFDAATQTAINQLRQLGITLGTTATTFNPNGLVPRWQMALFLTRLATQAGVALANPPPASGFTDIALFDAATQTAINQAKAVGIADGVSATLFDPNSNTLRWHMALFLTRVLAADGVVPTLVGTFTVIPGTAATLPIANPEGTSDDRAYTVTNPIAGTTHTIQLFPAANVTVSGTNVTFVDTTPNNDVADPGTPVATFISVNGAAASGAAVTAVPVNGQITFTIDSNAVGAVTPVVYVNSTNDGGLTLNNQNRPAESFGLGGNTTWAVPEAPNGAFTGVVASVNKSGDSFIIGTLTYYYDTNDTFRISGGSTNLAGFEAQLSSGDTVTGTYADTTGPSSVLDLTNNNPGTPVAPILTAGTNQVTVTWTPVAALANLDSFNIYRAPSISGTDCSGSLAYGAAVNSTDLTAPHTYTDTTVTAGNKYCYKTAEVNDGDEGTHSPPSFVSVTTSLTGRVLDFNTATNVITFDSGPSTASVTTDYAVNTTRTIGGGSATADQIDAALNVGDTVTYQPGATATLTLTNGPVSGRPTTVAAASITVAFDANGPNSVAINHTNAVAPQIVNFAGIADNTSVTYMVGSSTVSVTDFVTAVGGAIIGGGGTVTVSDNGNATVWTLS